MVQPAARGRLRGAIVLALGLSTGSGWLAADDERPLALRGIPLTVALERLRDAGLKILYSSDLVRPEMLVQVEPHGRWPREILDEILPPHGLRSEPGPAGALLILAARPPGSIRGVVVLGGTQEVLAGVRVTADGTPVEAVTDRRGEFSTGPLAEGTYAVEFDLAGFVRQRLSAVPVRSGAATQIRFELDPRGQTSEQVVVHPDPGKRDGGPEARQSIGHDELEALPEFAHDPLLAVGRLTGVSGADGAGSLYLRGGAADEVGIVLDGLELYAPYHLADRGGPISTIDSRNVAGIQLFGGAFPAEYGGYMSGVIALDTVTPPDDLAAELAYSSDDSRIVGQGRFGDGGHWLVSARRGDPSRYLDAIGADPNYHPQYWDLFAKADYRVSDRTSVSVDVLGAYDQVEGGDGTPVETTQDPGTFRSRHTSSYVWATVENLWSPRLYTRTLLSVGRLGSERYGSSARVAQVEDQRSTGILGLEHDAWLRSGRHLVKWGAEIQQLRAAYRYVSTPAGDGIAARDIELQPSGGSVGMYAADRIRVTRSFGIELGVRWDGRTYASDGNGSVNPRMNLDYALGARTTLRAGWGYFSQAPKIHELQVEDGVTDFFRPQRAEHRLVGIEHVLFDRYRLEASLYQKLMDDPSPRFENAWDPGGFFPEAGNDRLRIDPIRGRAEGLELSARSAGNGRVQWRASYALARAEDEIDGAWVPRSWDQRHSVDLGVRWTPAERWSVSLSGDLHSGQPTTPLGSASSTPTDGVEVDPIPGARNSARLPDYVRLDAGVGRLFTVRGTTLRTFLNVTNVLDRENVCCVERLRVVPLNDGSTTVEPVYRNGLPRLVTAGVSWTF